MQYIQLTEQASVVTVSLNRPEIHNAFNDEMIAELHKAFDDLGKTPSVRAVILAAEGKSFCAGADLNWMQRMVDYTFAENQADAKRLATMLQCIALCPKPVIGRVQGNAFGGGVGLLAACDFSVALKSSQFALTEVKLGLIPAVISPFVLRKIPTHAAQRYFLTGERFDAAAACRFGLIQEAVESPQQLDDWVAERIKNILANGPEAVAQAKRLIQEVLQHDWDRLIDITSRMIAERRASAEGQEGMRAFFGKSTPNWNLASLSLEA